jgi:hypothetical protein
MNHHFRSISLVVLVLALCISTPLLAGYGKERLTTESCPAWTAAAQEENQITVSGTVTDPQGAVVPDAQISLKLVKCKCSDCKPPDPCKCCPNQINARSNSTGSFSLKVPHGTYTISVATKGRSTERTLDLNEGTSTSTSITVQ